MKKASTNKDKYQRVLSHEDDSTEDHQNPHHHDEDEGEPNATTANTRRKTKRRGSQESATSYHSVVVDGHDDDEHDQEHGQENDNDNDNDIDEEQTNLSAERSSLRGGSFNIDTSPPKKSIYPSSISNLYSLSFGDDDDFGDDEADLKRYAIDFSMHNDRSGAIGTGTAILTNNSLHGGGGGPLPNNYGTSSASFSFPKYLWFSFQSMRQQARHRRAQLLLQQSEEHNWRQSVWICAMTYCDATDGGIVLLVSLLAVWGIVLWRLYPHATARRNLFLVGLIVLAVRIGARPAWDYFAKRRQRHRQRRRQMALRGGQGQQPPIPLSNRTTIPPIVLRPRLGSNISMDGSITTETGTGTGRNKARYSDQMVGTNTSFDSQGNMELSTIELATMTPSKKKATSRALRNGDGTATSPKSDDPAIHTI
jgi:hypothetical protein